MSPTEIMRIFQEVGPAAREYERRQQPIRSLPYAVTAFQNLLRLQPDGIYGRTTDAGLRHAASIIQDIGWVRFAQQLEASGGFNPDSFIPAEDSGETPFRPTRLTADRIYGGTVTTYGPEFMHEAHVTKHWDHGALRIRKFVHPKTKEYRYYVEGDGVTGYTSFGDIEEALAYVAKRLQNNEAFLRGSYVIRRFINGTRIGYVVENGGSQFAGSLPTLADAEQFVREQRSKHDDYEERMRHEKAFWEKQDAERKLQKHRTQERQARRIEEDRREQERIAEEIRQDEEVRARTAEMSLKRALRVEEMARIEAANYREKVSAYYFRKARFGWIGWIPAGRFRAQKWWRLSEAAVSAAGDHKLAREVRREEQRELTLRQRSEIQRVGVSGEVAPTKTVLEAEIETVDSPQLQLARDLQAQAMHEWEEQFAQLEKNQHDEEARQAWKEMAERKSRQRVDSTPEQKARQRNMIPPTSSIGQQLEEADRLARQAMLEIELREQQQQQTHRTGNCTKCGEELEAYEERSANGNVYVLHHMSHSCATVGGIQYHQHNYSQGGVLPHRRSE